MKISNQFNTFNLSQLKKIISEHTKYTNFNTLGLYRSILENDKLSVDEKIELRDFANEYFFKTFEFLQIKDLDTYIDLITLGQELTKADVRQLLEDSYVWQESFLKRKGIKHRNFGAYSKHECGFESCPCNGLMIRSNSALVESEMHFKSDKSKGQKRPYARKLITSELLDLEE